METALRKALIRWLANDPLLSAALNAVTEEAPTRTAPPWLGLVASASTDWSTKGIRGREVRLAVELHTRGDDPGDSGTLAELVEDRIESLPLAQDGFSVVTTTFLRARAEQRPRNTRAVLMEYRFRLLETA